jgi:hypothetical protein
LVLESHRPSRNQGGTTRPTSRHITPARARRQTAGGAGLTQTCGLTAAANRQVTKLNFAYCLGKWAAIAGMSIASQRNGAGSIR